MTEAVWVSTDDRQIPAGLKAKYVECTGRAAIEITSLRHAIDALVEWDVGRRQLVQCAVEPGYNTGYVCSLVCRILKDLNRGCRKPGGGRKVPREALALRALARRHYGEHERKFLLADYRIDQTALNIPIQFKPVSNEPTVALGLLLGPRGNCAPRQDP